MKKAANQLIFIHSSVAATGLAILLVAVALVLPQLLATAAQQKAPAKSQAQVTPGVLETFKDQLKQYVKLRERLESKLPQLSAESEPKEIEAHQEAFAKLLQVERATAKPGDIFTPEVARYIRHIINNELSPAQRKELKETVLQAETKGVPLRINYPYPETKEVVDMPPTVLLILPELPKELRYRFVGRNLLLVDREPRLIIDYMPNALP
jgi:hypothetical protein